MIRELSQGDAASCATQEATNLDGTAFFRAVVPYKRFANERRRSAELVEYASTVWDPHTNILINNIEMVQRRTARYTLGRYRYTDSVDAMLKELKWPSLHQRRQQSRLTMFYNPSFGDYRCGFEGYAGLQARNYANCRNLHTTRTI